MPGSSILFPNDDEEFQSALRVGADLVLFNRELDGFFTYDSGVEYIRAMKKAHPHVKTMLISNYADAQAAAVAAGAVPGFGKRQLGSKEVVALLLADGGKYGNVQGVKNLLHQVGHSFSFASSTFSRLL